MLSVNRPPQPIPIKVPVCVMLYRGLLPMRPVNYPSFRSQIGKSHVPIRPLPITIMGIADYQMPATSVKIEPRILAHSLLHVGILLHGDRFYFINLQEFHLFLHSVPPEPIIIPIVGFSILEPLVTVFARMN
jgi:hypothetical protein